MEHARPELEQAAHRTSEGKVTEQYLQLLEASSDGIELLDSEGRITFVNAPARQLLAQQGGAPEGLLGKHWEESLPKGPQEFLLHRSISRAFAEGIPSEFEFCHAPARQWFSVQVFPGPGGGVSVLYKNITAVKSALTSLDFQQQPQSGHQLREAYALLNNLLTRAPIGFAFFDLDLRFVSINEQLAEINGLPPAAHIGKQIGEVVPTLLASTEAVTSQILATGQPVKDREFVGETPAAPGRRRFWNESWYPVHNAQGEMLGFGVVVQEITARKEAEAALEAKTGLFQSVLTSAPLGLAFFDRQYRYVHINEELARINGVPAPEHLGKTIQEILPHNARAAMQLIDQVFASGESAGNVEVVGETPAAPGVRRFWLAGFFPVLDAHRTVSQVGVWVTEITERKHAEERLRESEERFRTIFEHAATAIAITDAQGRFLHCNPAYAAMVGYSEDELRALTFSALIHPGDREFNAAQIRQLLNGQVPSVQIENRFICRNGQTVWVHKFASLLPGPPGQPPSILALVTDVTDRRRAEDNLSFLASFSAALAPVASLEALARIAAHRIRQHFHVSRVNFSDVNTTANEVTVFAGDHDHDLRSDEITHRLSEYLDAHLIEELKAGRTVAVNDVATDPRTAPHAPAYAQWSVGSLALAPFLSHGSWRFMLAVHKPSAYVWRADEIELLREVSTRIHLRFERARAEQALQKAQAELQLHAANLEQTVAERTAKLQAALGELEAYSYSIAHDMRAPLRGMQGYSKLLLEEHAQELTPDARQYLSRIANSAERMDRLIQDVLSFSKIVSGELPLEPLDPLPLFEEIIQSYPNLQSHRSGITLQGPLPRVVANRAALTQVISNLLGNAVKFVAPGVVPRIQVWAEVAGSRVRFWIEDNGIGIDPHARERIFQLFQRLHRPELYQGTGLGLAIVRKAVERMHGAVGVESEVGNGSRFWLELPAAG